jgi:phenylpropionate dioxygenase-like ring-hydroxylating dioxygenase large terminal subunit
MTPQSPIPLAELEASLTATTGPTFLPAEAYTSPAFHRFEVQTIWRHEWVLAGRLEEIPQVGDYFAVAIAGEPLLVVRGEGGAVTAMSAVCRHRGMLVAEDRGRCERAFICPYHGWAYDRSGALLGAPQQPDLVGTGIALPTVRAEVWKGFIFVNLDPDAAPLAPRLEPLEEIVAPYGLEDLRGEFLRDPEPPRRSWRLDLLRGSKPYAEEAAVSA